MRSKLVAGNWKLNGSLAANEALIRSLIRNTPGNGSAECAVCAPYPYLGQVQELLRGTAIGWGSQDVSRYEHGAYTGEVSGRMLLEFGCRYAIVGHSERRTLFGDTDAIVAEKYAAARRAGLTPIFCIGETLGEREAGATEKVLERQVRALLDKTDATDVAAGVVAYEPVWAIGTGRTASAQQAQEAHAFVRRLVASKDSGVAQGLRILYGGSVKASNAAELFAMPDVDGGLVGGASLVADEFAAIWRAATDGKKG